MLSVCIETSTSSVSVALGDDSGPLGNTEVIDGRRHVETIIPALDSLLRSHSFARHDLTDVAVDVGPGLFTGLRVGVAAAKALALALDLRVVAFSSLEVLVWDAIARGEVSHGESVVAVVEARRGEMFAARYNVVTNAPRAIDEPFVGAHAEVSRRFAITTSALVVGDTDVVLGGRPSVIVRPTAEAMATLLAKGQGNVVAPDDLDVLYLRAPDAESNWVSR